MSTQQLCRKVQRYPPTGQGHCQFSSIHTGEKNSGSRPGMYSRAVEWDTYSLPQQRPTSLSHCGSPQITHLLHQAAASKLSPAIRLACCKAGGPMLKMTPRVFVVFLKISMSTLLLYHIRTAVDYRFIASLQPQRAKHPI